MVGALLARRTTDQTIAAWRQLRDQAPMIVRDHVMPEAPPVAPWIVSELLSDPDQHEICALCVRDLVRAWLALS